MILTRQHVRTGSQAQATQDMTSDLNTRVLQEISNLEERYRHSEEELRSANSELRRQLAEQSKEAREA